MSFAVESLVLQGQVDYAPREKLEHLLDRRNQHPSYDSDQKNRTGTLEGRSTSYIPTRDIHVSNRSYESSILKYAIGSDG